MQEDMEYILAPLFGFPPSQAHHISHQVSVCYDLGVDRVEGSKG